MLHSKAAMNSPISSLEAVQGPRSAEAETADDESSSCPGNKSWLDYKAANIAAKLRRLVALHGTWYQAVTREAPAWLAFGTHSVPESSLNLAFICRSIATSACQAALACPACFMARISSPLAAMAWSVRKSSSVSVLALLSMDNVCTSSCPLLLTCTWSVCTSLHESSPRVRAKPIKQWASKAAYDTCSCVRGLDPQSLVCNRLLRGLPKCRAQSAERPVGHFPPSFLRKHSCISSTLRMHLKQSKFG
mmetsp:Transcript_56720/g.146169  ORF Transcript_56720/g.146169 Transcript_56720/m.146169 type:complete len:248 (-) Transcript_56720:76-819(-)